jgi:hypothetical protein
MGAPLVIYEDWQGPGSFDEYDIDNFSFLPLNVAKAVSALLQSRREMIAYGKSAEHIKPELDKLYSACLEEWRDL